MEENKSKVYVLVDAENRIVRVDGGYTIGNINAEIDSWTLIDEGYGDRYNLCQSNYLPGTLKDARDIFRYKLVDGQVVDRTQEEMDADYTPPQPSEPGGTVEDRLAAVEKELASMETAYVEGVNEV